MDTWMLTACGELMGPHVHVTQLSQNAERLICPAMALFRNEEVEKNISVQEGWCHAAFCLESRSSRKEKYIYFYILIPLPPTFGFVLKKKKILKNCHKKLCVTPPNKSGRMLN